MTDQIDEIKQNIQSISSRTGNIGGELTNLKNQLGGIASKTEEKISGFSSLLNRSDQASTEFHKKTNEIIQEIHGINLFPNLLVLHQILTAGMNFTCLTNGPLHIMK